jgi:hypothetical protein
MMMKRLALIVAMLALFFSGRAYANEWDNFVEGIGKSVYFMAWPTATYGGVKFKDIRTDANGTDVVFIVYGTSAFGGGNLWTEAIVTVRDSSIVNLRWGENNAILAQPGETIKNIGKALEDLNRENHTVPATLVRFTWVLSDRCQDNLGIRVRFFDAANDLVWPGEGKVFLIPDGETREMAISAYSGSTVCFGAESDSPSPKLYWGVGATHQYGCDTCCYVVGNNNKVELPLRCN